MDVTKFGFITMAFGPDKYIRQAETLALSLRRHMPGIPIAVISDRELAGDMFDVCVPMREFSEAGTLLKLEMCEYSPFEETLFIDSDCVVTRPFHDELAEIRQFDFTPVVSAYLSRGQTDLYIEDLTVALDGVNGTRFPKFNGGVYFFRRGALTERIITKAREVYAQRKALTLKDFDKAGPGEETLIGLALTGLGITAFYDDHGRLMRTPLNMIGQLKIDALGGGCSFNKEGKMVNPAICHFCGPWGVSAEYRLADYALRHGRYPSAFQVTFEISSDRLKQFRGKVVGKLQKILTSA